MREGVRTGRRLWDRDILVEEDEEEEPEEMVVDRRLDEREAALADGPSPIAVRASLIECVISQDSQQGCPNALAGTGTGRSWRGTPVGSLAGETTRTPPRRRLCSRCRRLCTPPSRSPPADPRSSNALVRARAPAHAPAPPRRTPRRPTPTSPTLNRPRCRRPSHQRRDALEQTR